jgi:hypothetical protein
LADETMEAHPSFDAHRDAILDARSKLVDAVKALVNAQDDAYRELRHVEAPVPEEPEPEIDVEAPEPIFTTDDDYAIATKKLIDRKNLIGDLGGEE